MALSIRLSSLRRSVRELPVQWVSFHLFPHNYTLPRFYDIDWQFQYRDDEQNFPSHIICELIILAFL